MIRVPVNPELLSWARERAGMSREDLVARFVRLPEWESGEARPTLKQAEAFARTVHVPIGYLFLSEPPEETIPIPDFRVPEGNTVTRPSPNLLDMIHACMERQSWYRDFARVTGEPDLGFVGSASVDSPPIGVAAKMRETLGFDVAAQRSCSSLAHARRLFIRKAEEVGVLVMVSGIVLSDSHRPLDPAEFRGFAVSDRLAPLVFVNGKDAQSAQMFTLAHELAHIWLGATALSNLGLVPRRGFRNEEVWCNSVAAEFLVPLETLQSDLQSNETIPDALSRLAGIYKVSRLVILRRLFDLDWLTRENFDAIWTQERGRIQTPERDGGGGDFYRTTITRVGHRFARALIVNTLEGQTLYRDAFRMLGIRRTKTFNNLGSALGVME